jgi:epoxide hydrolase-like predicted phosphatase
MSDKSHVVYTPPVVSDNSKPDIKAVIFDLGGVVIEWTNDIIYAYLAERFGLEFEDVKERVKSLGPFLDKGTIDEKEFWTRFFKSFDKPLPDDWSELWPKKFREEARLDNGVMEIIKTLKRNGYMVAMITNTEPSHDAWSRKMGWYEPFEVVIASYKEKMRKPDSDIYEFALQELGLKGRECIFIDNREDYALGARDVGINAILFKNAKQLKEELKAYGVEC